MMCLQRHTEYLHNAMEPSRHQAEVQDQTYMNMSVRSFCCALLHSQEAEHEQWCQVQSDRQCYVICAHR